MGTNLSYNPTRPINIEFLQRLQTQPRLGGGQLSGMVSCCLVVVVNGYVIGACMGVFKNQAPYCRPPSSRALIIRTPKKRGHPV